MSSVGIIGGADGPTSVFIASSSTAASWVAPLLTVVCVIAMLVIIIFEHQKK